VAQKNLRGKQTITVFIPQHTQLRFQFATEK